MFKWGVGRAKRIGVEHLVTLSLSVVIQNFKNPVHYKPIQLCFHLNAMVGAEMNNRKFSNSTTEY